MQLGGLGEWSLGQGKAPAEIEFGAFYPYNMTFGGSSQALGPLSREAQVGGLACLPKCRHWVDGGSWTPAEFSTPVAFTSSVAGGRLSPPTPSHGFRMQVVFAIKVHETCILTWKFKNSPQFEGGHPSPHPTPRCLLDPLLFSVNSHFDSNALCLLTNDFVKFNWFKGNLVETSHGIG